MDHGIESTELLDVTSDDVARDDTADQLDHPVDNTGDTVDGYNAVGVVASIVVEIHGWVVAAELCRHDGSAGDSVHDHEDSGEQAEQDNRDNQDKPGWSPTYQGCDDDRTHALAGLVEAAEKTDSLEGLGRYMLQVGIVVVPVGSEGEDRAIEGLEAELVESDT